MNDLLTNKIGFFSSDDLRGFKEGTPVFLVKTQEWVYLTPFAFANGPDYLSYLKVVDQVGKQIKLIVAKVSEYFLKALKHALTGIDSYEILETISGIKLKRFKDDEPRARINIKQT